MPNLKKFSCHGDASLPLPRTQSLSPRCILDSMYSFPSLLPLSSSTPPSLGLDYWKTMIMSLSCLSRKQCHHSVLKIRFSLLGLPCSAPQEHTLLTLPSESSPPSPLPPYLLLPCMPFRLLLPIVWTSSLAFPLCVPPLPFVHAFPLFV